MTACGVVKKCGGLRKKILYNFAYYWEFCKSNLAVNYILFLSQ